MDDAKAEHTRGIILTLTAVLILSPDALLVRSIHADPLTLIFWRGLLSGCAIFAGLAVLWQGRGWQRVLEIGRLGLTSSALQATGNIFFIYALLQTSAANTLVILAAIPLISALLSRFFLREQVLRRTWWAILVGFLGVVLLFCGSVQGGALYGDLCAVAAACCWAGNLVLIRRARPVNMVPATGLGGLVSAVASLLLGARPLAIAGNDFALLLLLGLVLLPLAFALITLGPRLLPAPEVSLILLLETFLGPFWVWLVLGEAPSATTLAAGFLIMGTIAVHTLVSMRLLRTKGM